MCGNKQDISRSLLFSISETLKTQTKNPSFVPKEGSKMYRKFIVIAKNSLVCNKW